MKIGTAPERASRKARSLRRGEIAVILDLKSQLLQHAANARRPQRIRPHQRAALRRADLEGNAEQGDTRLVRCVGFRHHV
jgi:hypothetical protein